MGLDEEYNPTVATLQGRVGLSWTEMQTKLLFFEQRLDYQQSLKNTINYNISPSVNLASNTSHQGHYDSGQRYGHESYNRQPSNFSRGGGRSRGRGKWNSGGSCSICQVCGKYGYIAALCYHRFDKEFANQNAQNRGGGFFTPNANYPGNQLSQNSAYAAFTAGPSSNPFIATPQTVVDPNWYLDSGAPNHVTSDVTNLHQQGEYSGKEKIVVGNGSKLNISNIGKA